MSSDLKNLSSYEPDSVPSAEGMRIGIVVSEWNSEITEALYKGAAEALSNHGCKSQDVFRLSVPGTFELTLGAQWAIERSVPDAVICLGCVIQGETRHFDFICESVAKGITDLNVKFSVPVIFGVLTVDTMDQARARAGGKHGNKGIEAAITAIKMAALKKDKTLFGRRDSKPGFF